jgi:hypothetical protein
MSKKNKITTYIYIYILSRLKVKILTYPYHALLQKFHTAERPFLLASTIFYGRWAKRKCDIYTVRAFRMLRLIYLSGKRKVSDIP